jgi:hypothetical protein
MTVDHCAPGIWWVHLGKYGPGYRFHLRLSLRLFLRGKPATWWAKARRA